MEFDDLIVKESPGVCRCCLSEGCYKDLATEYTWMNDTEVYADMLLECFDISISQHMDGPNGPNRLICEVCITRLRDACNFKKQVVQTEQRFVDMLGRGEFGQKVVIYQPLKAEALPEPAPDDCEVEYLDEDMHFDDADDEPLRPPTESVLVEPSSSEDIIVSALKVKGKRGRPKKTDKPEKKPRTLVDEKPKSSKTAAKDATALHTAPMSSTKRNRIHKSNIVQILETSTVIPFKWHRQDYLCFFCHKPFKDTAMLKLHTVTAHKASSIKAAVGYPKQDENVKIDVTDVTCKLCRTKFENVFDFVEHLKLAHGRNIVELNTAGYSIIPYKLSDDSFQCAVCGEQFQYFVKLNQHLNNHFGGFVCELCGKSFMSRARLRCHGLNHGSRFRCNVCPESFPTKKRRDDHEEQAHDRDKSHKCHYCEETFKTYIKRRVHHHTAHGVSIPVYNCPVCKKVFHVMSRMETHMKEVHIKERNFACSMCEQRFFSRTLLQKHMVKHLCERVYQCDVCHKAYARKQTLSAHLRIHSNDKRFPCTLCGQAFVQNNSLRLHMRVHHPDAV